MTPSYLKSPQDSAIVALAMSHDGNTIIAGSDSMVKIWRRLSSKESSIQYHLSHNFTY